jgi:predicted MPP superfamily phosphohydrolase
MLIAYFAAMFLIFVGLDAYFIYNWRRFIIGRNYHKFFYYITYFIAFSCFILLCINFYNKATFNVDHKFQWISLLIASIWYLPKFAITPVLVIKDLIVLVNRTYRRIASRPQTESTRTPEQIKRRRFLQTSAWALAGTPYLLAAKGAAHTPYNPIVKEITLIIDKLPRELSGFTICQISDIHAGSFPDSEVIEKSVNMINNINPDICAITGDFVIDHPRELPIIESSLARIQTKYGVFACLGNHDHYMSDENNKILCDRLEKANINLLNNSSKILEINDKLIQIAGVDDLSFRNNYGDFDKAMSGLSKERATIMLCHDPTVWGKTIKNSIDADLTLSGHTHGGQVQINYGIGKFSPASLIYEYCYGLYVENNKNLYVNCGLGTTGPPIRIGLNPEITKIVLLSRAV